MNNNVKINALLLHENPPHEIFQNVILGRACYTAQRFFEQLCNIHSTKTGYGKLLKTIADNPGCSREKIRELAGFRGQCAEMFCTMQAARVTKNVRGHGYYITDLGTALLAYHNLI